MNKILFLLFALLSQSLVLSQDSSKTTISTLLDAWHKAAGAADFSEYFGRMTPDAVFIGTDATEYWVGEDFREFARPYFDAGKAWNFEAVQRHIYLNNTKNIAWFDELLDTPMGLCRGSGVLSLEDGQWKIAHYVLSIAVPNENVDALVDLKKNKDSLLLEKMRNP